MIQMAMPRAIGINLPAEVIQPSGSAQVCIGLQNIAVKRCLPGKSESTAFRAVEHWVAVEGCEPTAHNPR